MNTSVDQLAKIIWDYMLMHHKLEKVDLIICFGSHDLRSAEWAAKLYLDGYSPKILFSGKQEGETGGQQSEAELYKARAIEFGVPASDILIEGQSTNTGENIRFANEYLKKNNINFEKVIVVHKPYMERRTYATLKAQWPQPQPEFIISSIPISYEDYVSDPKYSKDYTLNIMVGDLQRISEYPRYGYQIKQEMPVDVWGAFSQLVKLGYDRRLINP